MEGREKIGGGGRIKEEERREEEEEKQEEEEGGRLRALKSPPPKKKMDGVSSNRTSVQEHMLHAWWDGFVHVPRASFMS